MIRIMTMLLALLLSLPAVAQTTDTAHLWWRKLIGRPAVLGIAVALLLAGGCVDKQPIRVASTPQPPAIADNQSLKTGIDFLRICRYTVVPPNLPPGTWAADAAFCAGVVRGLLFDASANRYGKARFCRPPNVTVGQAVRVVVDQFDRNPTMLHLDFEALAVAAFTTAWPCP